MRYFKSKLATAIILFNAGLHVENSSFIENDERYAPSLSSLTNVSFGLNTSWGRTCDAACQAAEDAENPYEEIEIVGEQPDEFEPPDIIDDGSYGGGDDSGDNDGDSGPGGDTSEPTPTESAQVCELRVDNLVRECKNTFVTWTTGAGLFCVRATFGVGERYCAAATATAIAAAVNWCDSQGQAMKIRECSGD